MAHGIVETHAASSSAAQTLSGLRELGFGEILAEIAARRHVTLGEMFGAGRDRAVVEARREFYLLLSALGWSSVRIARVCGGRDHTTILNALAGAVKRRVA